MNFWFKYIIPPFIRVFFFNLKKILYQTISYVLPPFILLILSKLKQWYLKNWVKQKEVYTEEDKSILLGKGSKIATVDIRAKGAKFEMGDQSWSVAYIALGNSYSRVNIGNNVFIGSGTIIDCAEEIIIEDDVLIAYNCIINDSDSHSTKYSLRKLDLGYVMRGEKRNLATTVAAPIKICKGAWITAGSIILKGVTIGEGAIVAAGSVVTRDVEPWTMVGGVPAKKIRFIPENER